MNMMQQNQQNASTDDTWSTSSNGRQNPIVPTTLNVEDWYVSPRIWLNILPHGFFGCEGLNVSVE